MAPSALLPGQFSFIPCKTHLAGEAHAAHILNSFGGQPACWLIEQHFKRFVIGEDPRDTSKIWDQMFKS